MSEGVRSGLSRRGFLGYAGGVAFPLLVPGRVLGAGGEPGANGRLNVAIVGCGNISRGHTAFFSSDPRTWVVAVCDVDRARAVTRKETVDRNCATRLGKDSCDDCAVYGDFREALARPEVDLVAVCTPDHWHVPIAAAAMRAGKDVYCEKPLTLTIAEGRTLVETARRYGRVLQTGSQQRSGRNFRFACELVRNGRIGELRRVETRIGQAPSCAAEPTMPVPDGFDYDFWLGPAPWAPYTAKRCHGTFRWIRDYSGGKMTDWGAHHNDIAQWGMGMECSGPVAVRGKGEFPTSGLFDVATRFVVEYRYANGVTLTCRDDGENGVRFEGTEGWVCVSRRRIDAEPKSLLKTEFGPDEVHLYRSASHHDNFLQCVATRRETVAPPEIGHRSASVCHLGNIAMLLGRELTWDPDRETFVGDPEANRMLSRPLRGEWLI
ncbi:MAG: Gfo/Idh/MocA family oxidoreductase [Lentisphaeria bacterium]|nr:Gfo/Idh/MocA family oxidoreductase [Lentisphaeria bacterium]